MILSAAVAAMFLFTNSPDPRVPADASGYPCRVFERHTIEVACFPGQIGPCYGTSAPEALDCPVLAFIDPLFIWQGVTLKPAPGQVVYGCVAACTASGVCSECLGEMP